MNLFIFKSILSYEKKKYFLEVEGKTFNKLIYD
jgi:hypothetical protein